MVVTPVMAEETEVPSETTKTEETEKQVEETKPAVTTTETKEEPKEEPKKGFLKRASESKAVKVGVAILALFGAAKVGEKIGERKAQREFNENIVDVEDEPSSEEEVSE